MADSPSTSSGSSASSGSSSAAAPIVLVGDSQPSPESSPTPEHGAQQTEETEEAGDGPETPSEGSNQHDPLNTDGLPKDTRVFVEM